jgi:FMN phosphatase YigB (HAD superfamily)
MGNDSIKAVVFDIGATLVTGPPIAPNKVIAKLIGCVTAAEVASVIMTTPLESAERVCSVLEDRFGTLGDECACAITELWKAQTSAPVGIEGAKETVVALKNMGLKIGLLSDIWSPYYAGVEAALPEVVKAADAIVLSCRTGSRKPNCANFKEVLSKLGVKPSEAVMVGDTYKHDILPALELGMLAVWALARPDREASSIIDVLNGKYPMPTATVANIADVLEILEASG